MKPAGFDYLVFWTIVIVAVYKVASLSVGLGFGYMGYRLFLTGIKKPAQYLANSSFWDFQFPIGPIPNYAFA